MALRKEIKIILILIAIATIFIFAYTQLTPSKNYDDFARCLAEKGATVYGTDACHACQSQKRLFGNSFQYVDYVKCDQEPQLCLISGIESLPTWVYESEKKVGVQSFEDLASWTGCEL